MAKYSEEFKRTIVLEYLSGERGYTAVGYKYSLDRSTVRKWVASYRQHGDAGLASKHERYSAKFKLSVLERIQREALSYRQAAAFFGLRGGTGVITAWERRYHEGGLPALEPRPRGQPNRMMNSGFPTPKSGPPIDTRSVEDLRKENEYLRAEVAYLKKLNALVQAKKLAAQKKRG
jgi:transposase